MTASKPAAPTLVPLQLGIESRREAWGFTGLLMVLYVINWGDKAVFGLIAQPLKDELGITTSQIGLVGSAFFLAFTIGGLLAGEINKWVSLRWALALLALGWVASMVPMVVAAGFTMLLISRMVLGMFEGPSSALIHTAVYSWHPIAKRGLPSACITASGSMAKIAVAPALALVVAQWGWRAALLTLAGIGLVWCVLWLLHLAEGPVRRARRRGDHRRHRRVRGPPSSRCRGRRSSWHPPSGAARSR